MNAGPSANILSYEPRPAKRERYPVLTQLEREAVITFPVPGKAAVWMNFSAQLLIAFTRVARAVMLIWVVHFMRIWKMPVSGNPVFQVIFELAFAASIALLAALYLRRYFRWGLVPRTLTVTSESITQRWLGWRTMRERVRSIDEVKDIRAIIVKDVFTRRSVAKVRLRFRSGFNRWMTIRARSPEEAENIRAVLLGTIGRT